MQPNCAEAVDELRVVLTAPNVPEVKQTIAQVRPDLTVDSATFRAAVLLLTGPSLRFNIDRMAVRTQAPRALVAACTRRLFDNGVWQPDGAVYAWTTADDEAFWKDVAVAEGQLCRRIDRLGRIEWASAGAWRKPYDFMAEEKDALSVAYVADKDTAPSPQSSNKTKAVDADEVEVITIPMKARRPVSDVPVPAMAAISSDSGVWLGGQSGNLFPGAQWLV
jgi:hypothetical protein